MSSITIYTACIVAVFVTVITFLTISATNTTSEFTNVLTYFDKQGRNVRYEVEFKESEQE